MTHRDLRGHGDRHEHLTSLRQDLSNEALIEAREQVDAGFRLAFPQLAEQIGIGVQQAPPKKPVDHATATQVGTKLLDAHKAVMEAAFALPLDGQVDLHLALNGLVNEIDRVTAELADRWGSE